MTRCIYFSSLLEVAHHTIHKVAATYISPPLSFMLVPWYRHVFSFLFFSFLPFYSTTWQVPHGFKEWWLKGHFIYVSSTGLIHVQLSPQSDPISSTILGPTFSLVKWWGPIIGLDPCGEIVVKRINLLWTNGQDVHYPMVSPIRPMLRGGAEEKFVPISSSRPNGLAPKLCHLRRHMGWVIVRANP
jgi:hypothetical protein